MPDTGWPGGIRLKIETEDRVIGWAIVHCKHMRGDARFGTPYAAQADAFRRSFERTVHGLHLANMDGHGPHGFMQAD